MKINLLNWGKRFPLIILILGVSLFLNTVSGQSIRKDYKEMTAAEKQVYVNALNRLYELGKIDAMADFHSTIFTPIHNRPMFLPWHRWFLYELETELRKTNVSGAVNISIPYWNWETDRSKTSPLWNQDFLGQFNINWRLNRNLTGNDLSLSQTIANVLSLNSFENYEWSGTSSNFPYVLESALHNRPHGWVDGEMSDVRSPKDPAFYLHHNMVDKIWQDWYDRTNIEGVYYDQGTTNKATSLPGYPSVNPYSIVDSRASNLKVWFANNGKVILNKYSSTGTENYRYTGKIEATTFTAKASTTVNYLSGVEIILDNGFVAESGSSFSANINADAFNTMNFREGKVEEEENTSADASTNEFSSFNESNIIISPNPSNDGLFSVVLLTNAEISQEYEVIDIFGKAVEKGNRSMDKAMEINLANMNSGVYILKMNVNGSNYIRRLVINK